MNTHNKLYTTLLGAAALLLVASAAVAQSEMTSKIRLECAAASTECPGAGKQYDFKVENDQLIITNSDSPAGVDRFHLIGSSGNLGLRTSNPQVLLHLFGAAGGDTFAGMGPVVGTPGTGPGFNYGYGGGSLGLGAGFFNSRPGGGSVAPNPSLRFMTGDQVRMIIDNEGFIAIGVNAFPGSFDPAFPLELAGTGAHLTTGGIWTNASSRALKQDISALGLPEAISTLEKMEPVTYEYKAEPGETYVGFIAEDVPALVASSDHKSMSPMDVVAVLTRVVQEHEQTIQELRKEISELKKQHAN
jgi:hypothetical protein